MLTVRREIGLGEAFLGGFVALFHPPGQLDFFLRLQKGNLSDLFEIHPHRIFHGYIF